MKAKQHFVSFRHGFRVAVSGLVGITAAGMLAAPPGFASGIETLKRNDLSCSDLSALSEIRETKINNNSGNQRLFQEYQSGDSIELRIPAEELLGTSFLSGKYKVGPNSSVRLNDGHMIFKRTEEEDLETLLVNYVKSKYGYDYAYITSSEPASIDYLLRGEVPLQSFLFTEKSRSATASSDLQKMGGDGSIPNSLTEFLKTRRPFTAYSDLKCLAIIRNVSGAIEFRDVESLVLFGKQGEYTPIYNGDIIYVPLNKSLISPKDAAVFSTSPYASDVQISITGWGAKPTIKTSPSGTNLFDMLVTSDSLQRGFSQKLKVYRYDTSINKYRAIEVGYPQGAQSFYPKDKDIVSVGKDAWSSTLSTINELTTPLVTALSSFFFFKGLAGF